MVTSKRGLSAIRPFPGSLSLKEIFEMTPGEKETVEEKSSENDEDMNSKIEHIIRPLYSLLKDQEEAECFRWQ